MVSGEIQVIVNGKSYGVYINPHTGHINANDWNNLRKVINLYEIDVKNAQAMLTATNT